MNYIGYLLLFAIIAALLIRLRDTKRQLKAAEGQLVLLQRQAMPDDSAVQKLQADRDAIWDHANTIHLYAALSEEESTAPSLKEKQIEIGRASEAILQILHP